MALRHTLNEWEEELRRHVGIGDVLLGQLPLGRSPFNEAHMNHLGKLLAKRIQVHDFLFAIQLIEQRYPLSLALYLVLQGIYNYEGGVYWPPVSEQLGMTDSNQTADCGRAFRRILRKYSLATFSHIHGFVNLVPILAHGGIPNYSIGDFFWLLQKSTKDSLITVDAESLIEDWGFDPENSFLFIDKPVERFILHGGAVAEDFIARCLALMETDDEEEINQLALPQRIVTGYQEWLESRADIQLRRAKIRLYRPRVYLDPYGDGVCLELPPQKFPSSISFSNLDWLLDIDGQLREVICDRDRTAEGYEFSVPDVIQLPVASEYVTSLRQDGEIFRRWTSLKGMGETPLLLFDTDTGDMLSEDKCRVPGFRWILYPDQYELTVTKGCKTDELPQQYGEWGKYAIEEWDLNPGSLLTLTSPEGTRHQLEIINEPALRRPHLVGGTQPLDRHVRNKFPLYSGQPPKLAISFPQHPDSNQLSRWRIAITPEGKARPSQRRSYLLAELREWISFESGDQVHLDLGAEQLLGTDACGKFEINAQGPYGRGRRLGLRIVPELNISGHRKLYLSNADGPAKLEISWDDLSRVQCLDEEGVSYKGLPLTSGNRYQVEAAPNLHWVKFALFDRENIRVPFTILIRRLRWALWQNNNLDKFDWRTEPIRLYPQGLADIYGAELRVDLPTMVDNHKLYGGWLLKDGQGIVRLEREPDLTRSRQQFSISLAELMPIIREAQEKGEVLCLQVWICRQTDHLNDAFIDALYLLPRLELDNLQSEWHESGQEVRLVVDWRFQQTIQHLQLFLWPADQPWINNPLCLPITGECLGHAEWLISKQSLPAGKDYEGAYIGGIEIVDPWSGIKPQRPALQNLTTILLIPPNARLYYEIIELAVDDGDASPLESLTLLAFQHRTQQFNKMYDTNYKLRLSSQDIGLEVDQMLMWADVVQELDKPVAYKLVQVSLFSEESVTQLETTSLDKDVLCRYLDHLSDNQIDSGAYRRLLVAGFPQVRRQCIAALCRGEEITGLVELLEDVRAGKILVSDAAEMLIPVYEFASGYLMEKGTNDAFDIFKLLTEAANKEPLWIEEGFILETNIGSGMVNRIREFKNHQKIDICWPGDDCELVVLLDNLPDGPLAFIDLQKRKIQFGALCLYQCLRCEELIGCSVQTVEKHYKERHTYESPFYREAKPPVFELTELAIHFPELGVEDESPSNKDY